MLDVVPVAPQSHLPPHDVRLYDPRKEGLIDTPVDTNGLVDLDELVSVVRSTVSPSYDWASPFNDVHHLHWPDELYWSSFNESAPMAQSFRQLVSRKAYLPRSFHAWTHQITVPPSVPSAEVMYHTIMAQKVATALAATTALAIRLTRIKEIPEHRLHQRLEQQLEKYLLYVDNARLVPIEFSLIAVNNIEADTVEQMLDRGRLLGRLALNKVPVCKRRLVTLAA